MAIGGSGKYSSATIFLMGLLDDTYMPLQLQRDVEMLKSVAFSPDGRYLMTASEVIGEGNGVVYVWGIEP